jgi:hypothetical protein
VAASAAQAAVTGANAHRLRSVPAGLVLVRGAAIATLTAGVATLVLVVLLMLPTGDMPMTPRAALVEISALAVRNVPRAMAVACVSAFLCLMGPLRDRTRRQIAAWAALGSALGIAIAVAFGLLHGWHAIIALFLGHLCALAMRPFVTRPQ